MVQDENEDPVDPLGKPFQNRVLDRGKRLAELRSAARSDPEAASQFEALMAEQVNAYDQLVEATKRFPVEELESPVAIFRATMAREIKQLREDAKRLRSKRK